ncbi:MAG: hypothetical protein JWP80_754 [Pseudomonas sp.]|nr:hypothetical protein [Pseudomonas sp.]
MTPLELLLITVSSLQLLSFVLFIYALYVKLDSMEECLKKNKIATDTKISWEGAGLMGKIVRISMIFTSLVLAPYWSKRKLLDLEEVRRFPPRLKLWLYLPLIVGVSSLAILISPIGFLS